MDPAYKKEQHDNMLQGRTTQFLNEFFCGQDAKSNTFKCLNYKKIKSLKLIKKERKENGYRVYYQVNSKKYSVTADWFIKIKDNKIIGLVGAVG